SPACHKCHNRMTSVKAHFYSQHATALRTELSHALSREALQALHRKSPARHLAIAARQFAILGLCTWSLIASSNPLVSVPLAFLQGFTIFNFTVLLHESSTTRSSSIVGRGWSACWDGFTPCRVESPPVSSHAGISTTTPNSDRPRTIQSVTICPRR